MDDLLIFQCVGIKNPDPDKLAYIFLNDDGTQDRVSLGKLYANVNRMSRLLLNQGIGKGDRFVIYMRNHAEFLYGLFAALSIGAVAVPVDPRSVGKKLAFQINNTKAKGVLMSGMQLENYQQIKSQVPDARVLGVTYKKHHGVPVSSDYPVLNELLENLTDSTPNQTVGLDFAAPAQIIHTSGTTGDPKGVVLKADRFMVYGFLADFIWQYQPDDVLYTGLSLTHGNAQSVTVIPSLAKQIPAVVSEKFTKSRLWDICRQYGCTSFSLLGGMMAGIYNQPGKNNDSDNPVRKVISAGTPRAIWEDFEKRFGTKIHEWYAAVEGGLAHNPPGFGPVGSFGKPPENLLEMKLVDENDNEVPPGTRGELISRMKSGETEVTYFGKEKESEKKTRGGWLRSGDLCHTDENGFFYFDFRKGGGLRRQGDFVQPDAIEKVVGEIDCVSEVCVYGIPAASGAPGEVDLVAAVAPFPGARLDTEVIVRNMSEKLEKIAIPSFLQVVPEIPKTVSEKPLDRLLKESFSEDAENVIRV